MPHYKDGTKAKVGDRVRGHCHGLGRVEQGVLVQITEGADTCNGLMAFVIAFPTQGRIGDSPLLVTLTTGWFTLKDVEKVE